MKPHLISIVIPTYNRRDQLARLLKSLLASTYKNIEILVIDDASTDGTSDSVKNKFGRNPKIKVIRNKTNLFAAGARNVGLGKSKGEFIFFVDDDNVIHEKAIEEMINVFLEDKTVGEVGPVNYSFSNKEKILWACTRRNMLTSKTNQSRTLAEFTGLKRWETDDVLNSYMVRSDVLKKNKITFRRFYGIMYEESDLAYRIRNAGYKIMVVRDAKIYHDIDSVSKEGVRKDYMYHFMEDSRRPYVFARNRIIFHSLFSSKIQLIFICIFWAWVFTCYYVYEFLSYDGPGNFSLTRRLFLASEYIRGTLNGIIFAIVGGKL